MSTRTRIIVASAAVALISVFAIGAYHFWYKNHDLRRVANLRQRLMRGDELSRRERNALKTQLMRTVDEMNPEQRRQLQRDLFRQQREQILNASAEYQQASDAEKVALLDRELDLWQRSRDVMSSLSGGRGPRMRGGGPAGGRRNRPPPGTDANRTDRPARGGRGGERPQLTDKQRTQLSQYMQALRDRAEDRGMRFSPRDYRGARAR